MKRRICHCPAGKTYDRRKKRRREIGSHAKTKASVLSRSGGKRRGRRHPKGWINDAEERIRAWIREQFGNVLGGMGGAITVEHPTSTVSLGLINKRGKYVIDWGAAYI